MSLERQALKGRQADRKLKLMELTVDIKTFSENIRGYLAGDIAARDQESEKAWALMRRWHELQEERAAIQAEYDEAEKELA